MRSTLISLATCLLISPAVVAQDTPTQPRVIPPGVIRVEGDVRPVFQVLTSRRARLGISVNLRARDSDSIGALVSSVTPNGPAAKAGIRSGDVITKLAGTSLLDGQARGNNDDSAPGLRLTELAARMANGVPQADGSIKPEPLMDVKHVGDAVLHMANLPLDVNVQFMTIMATKMPFVGRG